MAKKHSRKASPKRNLPGRNVDRTAFITGSDYAALAIIFSLTLIAYLPALNGTLVWDDVSHVTKPALQSLHGLWRIWSDLGATQQYYPLLHSAFWIEHGIWGDAVLGYHLTNVILHSLSAFLVVLIVRRLRLPGSWLAGLIFALHPVCVEGVAWISEQKSALSGVFYLAAGLAYLRFDESRRKAHYFWAAGFFVLALLSKTVTATLPAALLLVLWWRNGRVGWRRDVAPLVPWLGIGIFAGLFTAWVEKTYIGAQGADFALSVVQRCLLAGRVVWFYIAKLLWPSNLTFIYPRFAVDARVWWQYLFPAGLLALVVFLWTLGPRRRGLLTGFLFFCGTLFPVLGFFNVFPFLYSYVADHFQYLACLGIIVPASAGLTLATRKMAASPKSPIRDETRLLAGTCGVLLLALLVLTWRQSGIYTDMETLWRTTIARNPGSSMAHNNLGQLLFQEERVDEAMQHCRLAVALKPDNPEANGNLGNTLRYKEQYEEAIFYYRKASELQPQKASYHGSLGSTYLEIGKIEDAVAEYETALRLDSANGLLTNNLAWILATCPRASVRNGRRAVELALRAVQLVDARDPTVQGTLAAAYAETGRFEEAVATQEKACDLARATGDKELLDWHKQLLETYRERLPYRESTLEPK